MKQRKPKDLIRRVVVAAVVYGHRSTAEIAKRYSMPAVSIPKIVKGEVWETWRLRKMTASRKRAILADIQAGMLIREVVKKHRCGTSIVKRVAQASGIDRAELRQRAYKERTEIIHQMTKDGYTPAEIAKAVGIAERSVYRIASKAPHGKHQASPFPRAWSDATRGACVEDLRTTATYEELAAKYHTSKPTLNRIARVYQIDRRAILNAEIAERDAAIAAFINNGGTPAEAAVQWNVKEATIYSRIMSRDDVQGQRELVLQRRKDVQHLHSEGRTIQAMADTLGVALHIVRADLRKLGLSVPRRKTQARQVTPRQRSKTATTKQKTSMMMGWKLCKVCGAKVHTSRMSIHHYDMHGGTVTLAVANELRMRSYQVEPAPRKPNPLCKWCGGGECQNIVGHDRWRRMEAQHTKIQEYGTADDRTYTYAPTDEEYIADLKARRPRIRIATDAEIEEHLREVEAERRGNKRKRKVG